MADHGHEHGKGHADGRADGHEHPHGSMDIRDKEKTFAGFIRMTVWGISIAIGILLFLALASS